MFVYIDNNYYYFKDKTLVAVAVAVFLVSVLAALQAMNHLHSNHQVLVLVVLLAVTKHHLVAVPVLPVVRAAMNQHHTPAMLDMVVMQLSYLVVRLV